MGSLYAAAASYLDARAHGGRWLLRIEDLDAPRVVPGSAARIIATLEAFGFEWDGDIVLQSTRAALYADALATLRAAGRLFACACSRSQLADEDRYPGYCRDRALPDDAPTALRLRVDPGHIQFNDGIQGIFRQDVAKAVGDIVLRRRDAVIAYVLAVVVDDADQRITHVVRGADLLDNTPRQIYLQELLGYTRPGYAHVPVLTETDGAKLAKSRRSVRLEAKCPSFELHRVFTLLGLLPPDDLLNATPRAAWRWAIAHWSLACAPRRLTLALGDE